MRKRKCSRRSTRPRAVCDCRRKGNHHQRHGRIYSRFARNARRRFPRTLEEIADSDLLVHVVDAANQQALAHIESVDKILTGLELNKIPRFVVLNKADLLDEISIQALERTLLFDKGTDSVAVSAVQTRTLKPLLEKNRRIYLSRFRNEFVEL
jgi:50S ribosomal subunit-associated GTPase HflX